MLSLPGSPAIYCSVLCSLTAAGRKDLWFLSFRHRGWISRWLKELCRAARVCCMGWEVWFIRDESFAIILLCPTTSTVSRGHPSTLLAFFISSFSLFLSAAAMLLLKKTTPLKMADATTESKKVFRSTLCTPKDLSLLSRKCLLCPFLKSPGSVLCTPCHRRQRWGRQLQSLENFCRLTLSELCLKSEV